MSLAEQTDLQRLGALAQLARNMPDGYWIPWRHFESGTGGISTTFTLICPVCGEQCERDYSNQPWRHSNPRSLCYWPKGKAIEDDEDLAW